MSYEDPQSRFPLTFHPADDAPNKDNDMMMAIITQSNPSEQLRQRKEHQHHLRVLQPIGTGSSAGFRSATH